MCASCKTTNGGAITPEAILAKGGDEATMLAQILEEMKKLSTSNAELQAKVSISWVVSEGGDSVDERTWLEGRVVPRSPVAGPIS